MLSRALLLLGVARVCGFAAIRKIDGMRVGTESQSVPVGVASDSVFCTNVQKGLITKVDDDKWCGSLSKDVCGDSYTKVISYKIDTNNGMFNGCIWSDTLDKCIYSNVAYRCHPSCQGGAATNITMDWPSPPPPPSPSPPNRRELDAITAGRSLQTTCNGAGCPEKYTGEGECQNGWTKAVDTRPLCNGNQIVTTVSCTEGVSTGCTCSSIDSQPVNHECIDVTGKYWDNTGFTCCLGPNNNNCPPA